MALDAGTVFLDVRPNMAGFERELTRKVTAAGDRATGPNLAKMGEKFAVVGRKMSLGVSLPLLAIGGISLKTASAINESISKVNVVFEKSGKEIVAWSKTTATAMGLSQKDSLAAAGTFGNLFRVVGLGAAPAADMSKRLIALSADLGSFHDADPSEVLEAMRSGLVGETEPLRRFGVLLDDAALRAEGFKLGLTKSVKDGLTPAAKAQAAYSLIIKQTKLAHGDYGKTADSVANSQRRLKAQLETVSGQLGQVMLPIAEKVLGAFSRLTERFNNLSPAMRKGIVVFAGTAASMGVLLYAVGKTIGIYKSLTIAIRAGNLAFLANPVFLVVAGLVAIGVALYVLWNKSETFRRIVTSAFRGVSQVAGEVVAFIIGGFRFLANVFLSVAGTILSAAATAFGWVPGIGPKLKAADRAFGAFKDSFLGVLEDTAAKARGWGEQAVVQYASGLRAKRGDIERDAKAAGLSVARYLKLASPAQAGPLSEGGGPEGWGRRLPELYAAGMRSGIPAVASSASLVASAAAAGGRGGAVGRIPTGGGAGPNITFNIEGSLVHERQLRDLIKTTAHAGLIEFQRRNVSTGIR